MKTPLRFLLAILILSGCKTYNYYTPAPNSAFFANAGETHIAGDLGIYRLDAKGGVALTKNISLMGMYGGSPYNTYHASEGEAGIGFNSNYKEGFMFGLAAGYGLGNNYGKDSGAVYKNFYGSFTKPFFQFTMGAAGAHFEEHFTMKFDFMNYSGYKYQGNGDYASFNPNTFFWEPYFSGSMGGEHIRFEYGTGFAIKNVSQFFEGLRVCPWQFNIGLYIILNRKSE